MMMLDAIYALNELAAGRTPERSHLLAGAFALDTLRLSGNLDRDLLDAAAALNLIAGGGTLDLSEAGRSRAKFLAGAVRRINQQ
jgi:hypothetical protein